MGRLLPHDTDLGWTPYAWLIYIVSFAGTPLYMRSQATPAGWALYIGATLLFLVLYFRSHWVRGRELMLVSAATLLLGIAFWPVSAAAGALFVYAAGMLGTLETPRTAVRGVLLVAL